MMIILTNICYKANSQKYAPLFLSPPVSLNWANLFSVENLVNFNISSQMQSK